jgi:multidrug efflux pump subunit AcrB
MPIKSAGNASVLVADVGHAEDSGAIQTNIVRIDGQHSVYVPIFKQAGESNTIQIVNGMRAAIKHLVDIPPVLKTAVVFDQSLFVKGAMRNLLKEALIGLALTSLMILFFLGNGQATVASLLSIPMSLLLCMLVRRAFGGTLNTMLLGGMALVLSRLIDDSVVVLENIVRFMEDGADPERAAAEGGQEVSLAVLAATVCTSIVFFPVFLLNGVSKYIFTDLALGVVISIFASYFFSMTLVPLFCARFIRLQHGRDATKKRSLFRVMIDRFNIYFHRLLQRYETLAYRVLRRPGFTAAVLLSGTLLILVALTPVLGRAYFPRTDPGQFMINVRMPSGTRIEVSDAYIARVEDQIRKVVPPRDLGMIVSNIGITPDLSAIFTPNASMDTAFVQVNLKEDHSVGSYQYINRMRRQLASQLPELQTYFQAGGLVDTVINQGLPAPFDVQISSNDQGAAFAKAQEIAQKLRGLSSIGDVYIPQDLKYPGLQMNIDRERASLLGLSPEDVVDNVITALTSNGVIAPSYWIDPNTGNNYMLTVQYSTHQIEHMNMEEFQNIPLRGTGQQNYTPLRSVVFTKQIDTPTEVDHYSLRPVIDIYVQPRSESLSTVSRQINHILKDTERPNGMIITVQGAIVSMHDSFARFGIGILLSIALIYLVLMAQFASFRDPFIILMAIPPGLAGVVLFLLVTGSSLNVMSLMGVIMMTGIVVSNSILIVEFAGLLHAQGRTLLDAVVQSCKIRLRPILMTSLATLLGMIPMAIGLEAGSEQYAPLARALIGGLAVSVVVTVFLVPAVYLLIHGRREGNTSVATEEV